MKAFPIDFVRQIIEQTLEEEHLKNPNYFGGSNQVNLFSFYEQLQKEEEVDRYVEVYNDLLEQQNRTGLIMNGTIISPENPTITNLHQCLIVPMTFTCNFRVKIKDRDLALETLNNMINILKGRKQDIAELNTGKLFKVGTFGNNVDGTPKLNNGDFLGRFANVVGNLISNQMITKINELGDNGFNITNVNELYIERFSINPRMNRLAAYKRVYNEEQQAYIWEEKTNQEDLDIILPPEHTSITKYKVSMSFDSLRCDEPRNLNGEEYCVISFGGSATLVSSNVYLGNELTKVAISKLEVLGETTFNINGQKFWLEPLEMPNSNSADTMASNLLSNNFISNSHTNNVAVSSQYTFILDKDNTLLKQFFKYARYGIQGTIASSFSDGVTPNMIYEITELWSSWGNYDLFTFNGKVVESIDIENTESDTLSITIPIQLQGDNN